MSDKSARNGKKLTLYEKCLLLFALIFYVLTLAVGVMSFFVDVRTMAVVEAVFVLAVLASVVLMWTGNRYGKHFFVLSSALLVVCQLVGSGLALWANCAVELLLILLVVFVRNKKSS